MRTRIKGWLEARRANQRLKEVIESEEGGKKERGGVKVFEGNSCARKLGAVLGRGQVVSGVA